jgi:hypothetical protein
MKILVQAHCNPAIAIINGRTLVMPNWMEVPSGTTLDMLEWVRPVTETPKITLKHIGKYILHIHDNGTVTCDCPGFTFRKKCKHSAEHL